MRIVVAIDDSPYSKNVINNILRRHWPAETQFKIVSVVEPMDKTYRRIVAQEEGLSESEIDQFRKEHAVRMCEEARHQIERGVASSIVHFEVREGRPQQELLKAAADWDADRIVMGAHGHTVCPHNLIGSVSRDVAHHAHCHVEVARAG